MTVEERVGELLLEIGPWDHVEEINSKECMVDETGLDSYDIVEIVMRAEEKFGVDISDKDAEKFRTVQDLIDFLKSKG